MLSITINNVSRTNIIFILSKNAICTKNGSKTNLLTIGEPDRFPLPANQSRENVIYNNKKRPQTEFWRNYKFIIFLGL